MENVVENIANLVVPSKRCMKPKMFFLKYPPGIF